MVPLSRVKKHFTGTHKHSIMSAVSMEMNNGADWSNYNLIGSNIKVQQSSILRGMLQKDQVKHVWYNIILMNIHYELEFLRTNGVVLLSNLWFKLHLKSSYCQTSDISRTLAGNKTVDHSDLVRSLPVGTAPTTSSFST